MSTSSQEKLKCPIKINFDPLNGPIDNGPIDTGKVISYWAQVSFLKQTGMSGHKARRIAYRRVFGKGDAT